MTIMAKVKNFTKQVLGYLTGDTDAVVAAQNERKCNAALNSQIAVLEGKKVDLEEVLADRQEALNKAKYPATKITDGQSWISSVLSAKNRVEDAQSNLDDCTDSIAYYKAILAEYAELVDAPEATQA